MLRFLKGINTTKHNKANWGSSVNIVTGYGLDDRAIEFRSPAEAKEIFL
jgi:hypothetical protein